MNLRPQAHLLPTDRLRDTLLACLVAALCVLLPAVSAAASPEVAEVPQDPVARILAAGPRDTFALHWLEELCDRVGPRLTGSPQMDAAIDFAVRSLRAAGFDRVTTEAVTVPVWVRGEESARVIAPVAFDLPISGLGRSVGTPEGGITAEVMAVTDFAELDSRSEEARGKIVLFDPPWQGYGANVKYRFNGAVEAARHGAVAALVRSVTDNSLATLHTGVMGYDDEVPRIPAAAVTIEDAGRIHRLCDRGIAVRVRLQMQARSEPDREQATVVAELRGRELPEEIVVVGGHLDSWDVGTGAHDDGAGCAIAVGAAHLLDSLDLRPRRTVRVVLFASEEFGDIAGEAYLETHRHELDQHIAAIESDSGCFAPDGFSARTTPAVLAHLRNLAAPLGEIGAANVREGWAGVDIGPIVEQGVPGIGHRTKHGRYFDYHHSPADTFDKIDPEELAANVTAVAALIYAIADDPVSLRSIKEDSTE